MISKKTLRRLLYPPYIVLLSFICGLSTQFRARRFNQILWGQPGNDLDRNYRLLNRSRSIKGSRVLVIGVGGGGELEGLLTYLPAKVVCTDLIESDLLVQKLKDLRAYYGDTVELSFIRSDLHTLEPRFKSSFDIIVSNAVFEHVADLPLALDAIRQYMVLGGVMYANFGPLWFGWGGDHISGSRCNTEGFDHLLMTADEYATKMDSYGEYVDSPTDSRYWFRRKLFSFMSIDDYLHAHLNVGLETLYTAYQVEPRALLYLLNARKNVRNKLYQKIPSPFLLNALACGLTIISRKGSSN
jgi:SAM-dependent methyltransferase